ncbi:hypothetical protein LV89_03836 [Arcicella aurantiaca]|uniref:Uncharacterized protein n=1 Tax=Arcicella aurantiaca TaxID=591202 RepID=A0A316DUP0_9BACT|nr:hypothetical protein LV89_03836 [Arcicella aurantiaca]
MEKFKKETQWSPDGEQTNRTELVKPVNTCITSLSQNDTINVNSEEIPTELQLTTKSTFPPVHSITIDFSQIKR